MEHIIGTAGHVDHGKTVLVKALTGIDTDRLQEEKERGISIELGFAPLTLPSGRRLGLVDVPGHERFIRQMLAGVGGMDLVILVVAADEGVMPQTKEHLAIIDLLQIKRGIIAITKTDLVETEWLELVAEEIRQTVQGTVLASAPIIPVSAYKGQGIKEMLAELDTLAASTSARPAEDRVRLPIDRVFSITGFGTVVTGTLWTGTISTGDELEIQPEGFKIKVRNLQVHGQSVEKASAGQRVAINLAGADTQDVERGSCLLTPNFLRPTRRIDAVFKLLPGTRPLANRSRIRFYLGTRETFGRIVLLEHDELPPEEKALIQILMEEPIIANRQDYFIVRRYSPMETIGGGQIIDPMPRRHRRFKPAVLAALQQRLEGSSEQILQQIIEESYGGLTCREAAARAVLTPEETKKMLHNMAAKDQIKILSLANELYVVSTERYDAWWRTAAGALKRYHQRYPLRLGLAKEELRSRYFARLPVRAFQNLLEQWAQAGLIKLTATFAALIDFEPQLKPEQKKVLRQLVERYRSSNFQPPAFNELLSEYGLTAEELEELLHYLCREGLLVKINNDFYWHYQVFEIACEKIKEMAVDGPFGLGKARDVLGSSRKYILPFLEYLDQIKVTRRQGDERIYIGS